MVKRKGSGDSGSGGTRRTTTADEGKTHEATQRKAQRTPRSPSRTTTSSSKKGKK